MQSGRVVVIGAGPGGLSMAWRLDRAGIPGVVLERATEVAASWKGHYESARLFSTRRISSLPGMTMPRRYGTFVGRDDFIAYLEAYAARIRTPVRYGVDVRRIDRGGDGYVLRTSEGDVEAAAVVVATGITNAPFVPRWPGLDAYEGRVVLPTEYRNGAPYRGQDVLVVGAGTTGTDIVLDLVKAGAARVRVAVRTPPQVWPLLLFGMPLQAVRPPTRWDWFPKGPYEWTGGKLHQLLGRGLAPLGGLPPVTWGNIRQYEQPRPHALNFDTRGIKAIKAGLAEIVPAVERFEPGAVVLADGSRVRPDAVIAATGRTPGLEGLVGHLGVLGVHGRPVVHGARTAPGAPGLHFLGFRMPPAQLCDMRSDSRAIARALAARGLGSAAPPRVARRPVVRTPARRPSAARR